MRFKPGEFLLGALIAAGALSAARVRGQTAPSVRLLGRVSVFGKQVLLSDLLPRDAPDTLRLTAARVSLGPAPQPGRERSIDRAQIERSLLGHTGAFSSLSVPDRITVSSAARPITAEEAYQAIRTQLRTSDIPAAESLRPGDVQLGAQVFVRLGDAGLRVTRTDVDPILGQARFLLWPANDPQVVPFFATVRLDAASRAQLLQAANSPLEKAKVALAERLEPGTAAERQAAYREATRAGIGETLVRPGQRTVLTLENAKMQITVDVVPLERGSLGQRIRVRMADSGKIVTAEVIGRARLEAQL